MPATPAPAKPAPAPIERPKATAHPDINKFRRAPSGRNEWMQDIPALHTVEDILSPTYWAHAVSQLTERDAIECWWEDGSKFVVLRVVRKTRYSAHVFMTAQHDLVEALDKINVAEELAKYLVQFNGPGNKYRLIRKTDNALIRDGFDTEDAALRWLVTEFLGQPLATAH